MDLGCVLIQMGRFKKISKIAKGSNGLKIAYSLFLTHTTP